MHRRIFAIPLCIILCVAVFSSSSVFALPPNDFTTNVNCTWQLVSGLAGNEFTLQSGSLSSWGLWSPNSDNYVSLSSYSGVMPVSYDLYIAVLTSSLPHVYFEGLDDYYYPAGNITETVSLNTALMYYDNDPPFFKGNTPLSTTVVESVTFCYFRDVPAGTSFQVNDINPYPPEGTSFINAYSSYAQANVNFSHYLFGFFFANAKVTGDQIVEQFQNGEISFDDAISSLKSLRNDSIDNSSDYIQSLLNFSIVESQIEEIIRISDLSFSSLIVEVTASLQDNFEYIRSGLLSVSVVLDQLPDFLDELLSIAVTPEQGSLCLSWYTSFLDRLEFEYSLFQESQLSEAVPDEYVDLSDEYIAAEDEIFALFDREELEAQIAYETWLYQLPIEESSIFKNYFNYLISNSPIKFFITVPMCLGLVSILLGTRINLFRGESRPSDEERYWKSTADNYYNFRGG